MEEKQNNTNNKKVCVVLRIYNVEPHQLQTKMCKKGWKIDIEVKMPNLINKTKNYLVF